jgi:hypothetical protein
VDGVGLASVSRHPPVRFGEYNKLWHYHWLSLVHLQTSKPWVDEVRPVEIEDPLGSTGRFISNNNYQLARALASRVDRALGGWPCASVAIGACVLALAEFEWDG